MNFVKITDEVDFTATPATQTAETVDITGFFGVAVPKTTATRAATHCYPESHGGEVNHHEQP